MTVLIDARHSDSAIHLVNQSVLHLQNFVSVTCIILIIFRNFIGLELKGFVTTGWIDYFIEVYIVVNIKSLQNVLYKY